MEREDTRQKLVRYLNEAHAAELALARTLRAHLGVTPAGGYRDALQAHARETKEHAARVERRLAELGAGRGGLRARVGAIRGVVGQTLALGGPREHFIAGGTIEENLLCNVQDECMTEGLAIAAHYAVENLARAVGDEVTAALAVEIRTVDEAMLEVLRREIRQLGEAIGGGEGEEGRPGEPLAGEPAGDPRAPESAGDPRAAESAGDGSSDAPEPWSTYGELSPDDVEQALARANRPPAD